jgi:hypothetical protein
MRFWHWVAHEIRAILMAMLFFLTCFTIIVVLKNLVLEEYKITAGLSASVFMLSLVTAKVVVLFERVSFGRQIGLVEVLMRSATYSLAAFLLLLLEHGLSERKAEGGFYAAVANAFQHPDMPFIWGTLICVTLAFLVWTALVILRREFGRERLMAAYLKPSTKPVESVARH